MNPFDILGIPHGSSKVVAQGAYRKLAMLHHPDRGGSEAKFKEVKEAYESIERGYVQPEAQKPRPQQKPKWTKPVDAYQGFAKESGYVPPGYESPKPKPYARYNQPPKAKVIPAYNPVNTLNSTYIVRASLAEAYRGFVCEITHNGTRHQIAVPRGAPDGLRFGAKTPGLEDVTIVVRLNQSFYSFDSLDTSRTVQHVIDGIKTSANLVGDLGCDIEVSARETRNGTSVELEDFLGVKFKVQIPAIYNPDRATFVIVPGKGYVHWLPELKKASDTRGDVRVRITVSQTVPASNCGFGSFM